LSRSLIHTHFLLSFVLISLLFLFPSLGHAVFSEQMAISTKAISLANTVTADPPGHASIHYNPAGLSKMKDGKYFSQGMSIPWIVHETRFKSDPDFDGFIGGEDGDPLDGSTGKSSGGRMYIPIIDETLDFLVSPGVGLSYRKPGSKWTFALSQYAPFAVGMRHDDPHDPVRYQGKAVYQQHLIYVAPGASYQLTDTLSLGLSVGMGQTAMGAEVEMRAPSDLVGLTKVLGEATAGLEIPVLSELTLPPPWFGGGIGPYERVAEFEFNIRDDFSPNYNLGALWEPYDWLSLGIVYQSAIETELTGSYKFSYEDNWQNMVRWFGSSPLLMIISGMFDLPYDPAASQSGTATHEIEFPQRIQAGVKVKPLKKLSLLADIAWADWSVLDDQVIKFDQDIQLLKLVKLLGYSGGNDTMVLTRNFKDTITWSVGAEYQLLDWLCLRGGYEFRETSVQDEYFDAMMPLPDLHNFGLGAGLSLPNGMEVDLAVAYMYNHGYKVPNDSSTNMNSLNWTKPVYNPYAGLDYEQDIDVYMVSANVTMPWDVFLEMQHHQKETIHKLLHFTTKLNPFKKESVPVPETEEPATVDEADVEVVDEAPMGWLAKVRNLPIPFIGGGHDEPVATVETESSQSPESLPSNDELIQPHAIVAAEKSEAQGHSVATAAVATETAKRADNLDNNTIAVVEQPTTSTLATSSAVGSLPEGGYALKLAEFDSRERAELAASYYRLEGVEPYLVEVQSDDDSTLWAIYTGNFSTLAKARHAMIKQEVPEAQIAEPPSAGGFPIDFYSLRLAEFQSSERAEMALSYYRLEGFSPFLVQQHASEDDENWIVYSGFYTSYATAEREKNKTGLTEADIDKSPGSQLPGNHPYCLKLAEFQSRERAEIGLSYYRMEGVSPYLVREMRNSDSGKWVIYTGYYPSFSIAESFKQKYDLVEATINKTPFANLVGIFVAAADLETMHKTLSEFGYSPYVVKTTPGQGPGILRLYVGAFASQEEAEHQHSQLTKAGIQSRVVRR